MNGIWTLNDQPSLTGLLSLQLGDLPSAFKPRMSDSNKNLTVQALGLLAKLARAMGKAIDRAARQLLDPALKNISDQKAQVWGGQLEPSGMIWYEKRQSVATGVFFHKLSLPWSGPGCCG